MSSISLLSNVRYVGTRLVSKDIAIPTKFLLLALAGAVALLFAAASLYSAGERQKAENGSLQKQINALGSLNQSWQQKSQQAQENNDRMAAQEKKLEVKITVLSGQLKDAQAVDKKRTAVIQKQQRDIRVLKASLADSKARGDGLAKQLDAAGKQNAQLMSQAQDLAQSNDALQKQVKTLNADAKVSLGTIIIKQR